MKVNFRLWLLALRNNKPVVITVISLIIIEYVSLIETDSDLITLGILGSYIYVIYFYKLKSKTTFSFCFFVLFLLFVEFVVTGTSVNTEKAAVFLFFFMAIGIVQELLKINETS